MKHLCLCLVVCLLVSCNGKDSGGSSCASTKEVFSTWTSRDTGNIFPMQNCTFNSVCEVKFGPGACSDVRGDFNIVINENGRAIMGNCAGDAVLDQASYGICNNLLSITYDSNGDVEVFD